jgi:hypothetical protein
LSCQFWHLHSQNQEWRLALKHKDALDLRFASDAMAMAHENHLPSQMARKIWAKSWAIYLGQNR